jgi:3-oxoacyl-[acyl-carrier-protein] synthase-3
MPQLGYAAGPLRASILGVGAHVPEQTVTNDDLALVVETSDTWIRQRTGIAERRRAAVGQTTAELALPAARRALQAAEVLPSELELIILGTTSPDQPFPATACHLQRMLGAEGAVAFDVLAACTSWIYASSIAERYIASGAVRRALVVGAEVMSRVLDHNDRATSILFGDGAGAAVLGPSTTAGFESFALAADGNQSQLIHYGPAPGNPLPALRMEGNETFRAATRLMEDSARRACELAGVSLEQVDMIVPHQANVRIVEGVARRLGVPLEKFFLNLDHYGNTSAASIPLALHEALARGRLHTGDRLLLVGFGAGMTWGATVLTWGV